MMVSKRTYRYNISIEMPCLALLDSGTANWHWIKWSYIGIIPDDIQAYCHSMALVPLLRDSALSHSCLLQYFPASLVTPRS